MRSDVSGGSRFLVCHVYVPFVPGGWGVIDATTDALVWYQQGATRKDAEAKVRDLCGLKASAEGEVGGPSGERPEAPVPSSLGGDPKVSRP